MSKKQTSEIFVCEEKCKKVKSFYLKCVHRLWFFMFEDCHYSDFKNIYMEEYTFRIRSPFREFLAVLFSGHIQSQIIREPKEWKSVKTTIYSDPNWLWCLNYSIVLSFSLFWFSAVVSMCDCVYVLKKVQ